MNERTRRKECDSGRRVEVLLLLGQRVEVLLLSGRRVDVLLLSGRRYFQAASSNVAYA